MILFSYHCVENPGLRVWLGYHPIASVDAGPNGSFCVAFHSEFSEVYDEKTESDAIERLSSELMLSRDVFAPAIKMLQSIRTEVDGPRLKTLVSEADGEYVVMNGAGVELKRFGSMRRAYEFAIAAAVGVGNKYKLISELDEQIYSQRYINAYQLLNLFETYDVL